jgi:hypothetical protein
VHAPCIHQGSHTHNAKRKHGSVYRTSCWVHCDTCANTVLHGANMPTYKERLAACSAPPAGWPGVTCSVKCTSRMPRCDDCKLANLRKPSNVTWSSPVLQSPLTSCVHGGNTPNTLCKPVNHKTLGHTQTPVCAAPPAAWSSVSCSVTRTSLRNSGGNFSNSNQLRGGFRHET